MRLPAIFPYLQLMRPANILTAWADILLGVVVVNGQLAWADAPDLLYLLLATTGLYGGGVVLNDVFDLETDRMERPERPLPSGRAGLRMATVLGVLLLLLGVAAAAQVQAQSAVLAFAVAALALIYDAFGKHHSWLGPLNMGACRSGNLLLGMSLAPISFFPGILAVLPLVYISSITLISRGEVGGSGRRPLWLGLVGYLAVAASVAILAMSRDMVGIPFLLLFCGLVFPPLGRALAEPSGPRIGRAVRAGVLALVAFDAALAAAFGGLGAGLLILALLPFSLALARFFAVT